MASRTPRSVFVAVREAARRPMAPALIALAAILWLAVAGIVAAFLYNGREATLERATRQAEALTSLLEAHIARTYQAVDITLAGLASTLRVAPDMGLNDRDFRQVLRERLQALQPYGRALFVVDAGGRLVQDTWYRSLPGMSLADRDYFRAHLENPALKSAIWAPLRSRADAGWFLAVTHAIAENGPFKGIVAASIEPHYFQALFSRLGLGSADMIALYYSDGTLIARHPYDQAAVGASFANAPVFKQHLAQASAGTYVTGSGLLLSDQRMVSYRALEGMPLLVTMAQSTESILRAWRRTAVGAAVALGVLLLLFAALVAQFLRQQRIRDLARMRSMQSEKLEALGHLTGSISHDFANLLNVMSASLRVITLEPPDPRRMREAAAVGERAIVRGSYLVEQLRTFARRQPLHVQPANLNLLIDAGVELLRHVTGRDVKLQVQPAASVSPCLLDETELEVALVNLLVNAKDAGAREVTLKTFDCTWDKQPAGWHGLYAVQYVCLSVIDDGPGMGEDVRRRAFEPYFSTKGTAGTGLGLAQVYGFMRQVGGDVHIDSLPGKGAAVHLLFRKATVVEGVFSA